VSLDPVALATQLAGLRQNRSAGAPLTAEHPGLDLDLAYAVQEAGVRPCCSTSASRSTPAS
jgi:hypothetical protein